VLHPIFLEIGTAPLLRS